MKQITLLTFLFLIFSHYVNAQCLSGDCQNGTGIFLYPSGAKYIGQFKKGEIHGIGTCYYTDGSKYQGEWKNRFPDGRGTKTFPDGATIVGEWKRGNPVDEHGNLVDSDLAENDIQAGCISGNCKSGFGVFAYADGSKYEGNFEEGQLSGEGTFLYANGEKYVGNFQNGYKHGRGTYFDGKGTQRIGLWEVDEYIGTQRLVYTKAGCIEGDCKNGKGVYVFDDYASKYSGHFKNNLPEGSGVILYGNGERYEGDWRSGNFGGYGTLFLMDGTEVAGWWEKGVYIGHHKKIEVKPDNHPVEFSDHPITNIRNNAKVKVWAVIVGIAAYDHMPTLRYTDDDAYRMFAHFKSPEGGALADEQIRILIDEDATKAKILETMQEVFGQAGPNDLVVFYFSGHGLKGSFLPIDFDGFNQKIEHHEIDNLLENSPAKYKLMIADACHSGSMLAMKSGNVSNILANYYDKLASANAGTALIMSSKSNETSLESSGLRQGVFSHFLIRGLKGEADKNSDGVVAIQELYDFIDERVRTYTSNRQSPLIQGDFDRNMPISVVR